MKIELTKQAAKRIKKGVPLIHAEDMIKDLKTKEWVTFSDYQGHFLGRGYLGKQNKGSGWLLTTSDEVLDQAFFEKRLLQAKVKRNQFYQDEQMTAFRLVNGEGDKLGGLTVDKYGDFAVFSWYNETLYEKRQIIVAAFREIFPEIKGAYEKNRFDAAEVSAWLFGEKAPEPLLIKENNVNYAVYLNEGLMTGIFLDQKEVRGRLISGLASGKKVLNMFSYTGAFSVAAAMGGASQTTSVDLAKRSRPKTQEQFMVNGLSFEQQKIYVMDTFAYFKYAQKKQLSFDLIILDPPSFARNKKKVFSVAKDYGELIEQSVAILAEKGVIIASTNAANLASEKFQEMIEAAFERKKVTYHCRESYQLPADFTVLPAYPEGNYLKVLIYEVEK